MGKQHGDEVRAAAMAALLEGQSINSVAEEYSLPRGTVANWAGRVRQSPTGKNGRIGELLEAYLEASLETLRAQVVMFRNVEWLEKQDASSVAVLHGVVTDKAIRLLEALQRDDDAG